MFDIGFTELLVCLVVALVVIGPEQLPGAVRAAGLWIGRLKRSLRDTRNEIERQIGADDIRRQLHNEEVMQNIEEARIRFERTILEAEQYESAAAETRHHAIDYAPPDELPDHAHGHQAAADQRKPVAPTSAPTVSAPPVTASATAAGTNTSAPNSPNTPTTAGTPTQSGTGH